MQAATNTGPPTLLDLGVDGAASVLGFVTGDGAGVSTPVDLSEFVSWTNITDTGQVAIPVEVVGMWSAHGDEVVGYGPARQWGQSLFQDPRLRPEPEQVPVSDIHYAAQDELLAGVLLHYLGNPGRQYGAAPYFSTNDHPVLLLDESEGYVVLDGCHRTGAAKLRGDDLMRAYVIQPPSRQVSRAADLAYRTYTFVDQYAERCAGMGSGPAAVLASELVRRGIEPELVRGERVTEGGEVVPHCWLVVDGHVVDPTRPQFEWGPLAAHEADVSFTYMPIMREWFSWSAEESLMEFVDDFGAGQESGYFVGTRLGAYLRR